ncbi:cytochrome c oxidase subunit 6C [Latimeria chalumnae]|uniref:cytochrome c oxidase subunit 6C n=1 Tax=Latimeria chalumnae TaxID=7897 RepID=UPI0003C1180C|nr:PREDICTED: cytochrome c oxidase subunit 6C [Latimeria chalumnae]|eukprot:XP_005995431.1 PREDICTED: cytochrome c oxidase subunit 6C [Latimeria chalumnae]
MSSNLLRKPVMRGFLARRLRFHLSMAFMVSLASASFIKFTIVEPKKKAYAEFYKTFDAMKTFEAMREAGVFESVRPKGGKK